MLYPKEGCLDPEDIMKQVKDFDIKEEARKVRKGKTTLFSLKTDNVDADSLPRSGSPVNLNGEEVYSGNPINLIKKS